MFAPDCARSRMRLRYTKDMSPTAPMAPTTQKEAMMMVRTLVDDSPLEVEVSGRTTVGDLLMVGVTEGVTDDDVVVLMLLVGLAVMVLVELSDPLVVGVTLGDAPELREAVGEVVGVTGTAAGDSVGDMELDPDGVVVTERLVDEDSLGLAPTEGDTVLVTVMVGVTLADMVLEGVGDTAVTLKVSWNAKSTEDGVIWCTSTAMLLLPTMKNLVGSNERVTGVMAWVTLATAVDATVLCVMVPLGRLYRVSSLPFTYTTAASSQMRFMVQTLAEDTELTVPVRLRRK